jgi:hypothetical protein
MYFASSGFFKKDAATLVKYNKHTANFESMIDVNYVPVANKANQISTRIEFGAMVQSTSSNATFMCGTLYKLNDDSSIKSGAIFLAKIDGPTGRKLNFLYSWGSEYPYDYDKCNSMTYDQSRD